MSAASPRRTLITGASRPLGIELVRQCLIRGDMVYAACRNPARVPVLADLRAQYGGLEFLALDPADPSMVADAVPVLENLTETLDLLVLAPAEAGPHDRAAQVARDEELSTLSGTGLTEHYRRHAVAPLLLVRTLLPWLAHGDGARVLVVSTARGSLSAKRDGGGYATAASAAALHMLTRALAHDLRDERIVVCLGNPGRYAESPDDRDAPVLIEDAALGLLVQTERLSRDRSGVFIDWTGADRAW
ncbi:MAG TPA: SDR family NAD(P)-dependent oxidoreductase [Gemmatimonas sp.]|uniref:SDR family NAD(P)-dependent oxidoreductase n=1 Tax=Gemmatimonas sp. TaxID=1962908 RepID=UPI002ED994FB